MNINNYLSWLEEMDLRKDCPLPVAKMRAYRQVARPIAKRVGNHLVRGGAAEERQ